MPEDSHSLVPMRPKRMNPLLFYPPHVLNDINRAIDEGWKGGHVYHLLSSKWNKDIPKLPAKNTVHRYVKWYLNQKGTDEDSVAIKSIESASVELEKGIQKLLDPQRPISDKKEVLELLIRKCVQRIRVLEKWQRTTISPAFEGCLVRYFSEIRSLIEIIAKLNSELSGDNSVIINIIDSRIQSIIQAFYNVIKAVVPDKIEVIRAKLKEEMRRLNGG